MRSFVVAAVLCLCGSEAFGQYAAQPGYYPAPPVAQAPQQSVQVQVAPGGNVPPLHPIPPMGPGVSPNPVPALPVHEWRDGFREEWKTVHEIRPVREYEHYPYQQRTDGFYYNPNTACYQRDYQPVTACQPQYQFYQPYYYQQPQYYYYPQRQRPWWQCW